MVDQQSSDVDFPESAEFLPAWFSERMMSDVWSFGLLMITGDVIAIESINRITKDASGNLWLDATLLDSLLGREDINGHKLFLAPTSRTTISINAFHVVAAFELADT
jgi:hypothetical protein